MGSADRGPWSRQARSPGTTSRDALRQPLQAHTKGRRGRGWGGGEPAVGGPIVPLGRWHAVAAPLGDAAGGWRPTCRPFWPRGQDNGHTIRSLACWGWGCARREWPGGRMRRGAQHEGAQVASVHVPAGHCTGIEARGVPRCTILRAPRASTPDRLPARWLVGSYAPAATAQCQWRVGRPKWQCMPLAQDTGGGRKVCRPPAPG